jgi:flavin-dependent dehydrogenase
MATVQERFDAIVVGAGPAGNAAAYTMAKNGLNVLQLERGEYPGSKNVRARSFMPMRWKRSFRISAKTRHWNATSSNNAFG